MKRPKPISRWLYLVRYIVNFPDHQEWHRALMPFDQRLDQDKYSIGIAATESVLEEKWARENANGIIGGPQPSVEIMGWQLVQRVEIDTATLATAAGAGEVVAVQEQA